MADGRDLTGYPGNSRREEIRPKLENATNKENGKEISNIIILLKEGSVWKNLTGGLTWVQTDIGFLGFCLFKNILRSNCSATWPESVLLFTVFLFKINVIYKHLNLHKSYQKVYYSLCEISICLCKIYNRSPLKYTLIYYNFRCISTWLQDFPKPQMWLKQTLSTKYIMPLGSMYIF